MGKCPECNEDNWIEELDREGIVRAYRCKNCGFVVYV